MRTKSINKKANIKKRIYKTAREEYINALCIYLPSIETHWRESI